MKTKIKIVAVTLLTVMISLSSFAQWTQTGSILYPTTTTWNVGIGNTAPGYKLDVTGDINIATSTLGYRIGGTYALRTPTTTTVKVGAGGAGGDYNAFVGYESGNSIQDLGNKNTFVGYRAGYTHNDEDLNTYIGYQAGYTAAGGEQVTCLGAEAGFSITTGGSQTFIGYRAGYSNTTASYNVYVGNSSGYTSTTATYNAFLGMNTGLVNTGSYNSFLGHNSGAANTTGNQNAFVGYVSGYVNTTGTYNTFLGSEAGRGNTTANSNTYVGNHSGFANTTGASNTALGANAGDTRATCSSSTFIGYNADASGNHSNCAAIGASAITTAPDMMYLGDVNADIHCMNNAWSGSDGRFKFNVQENVGGLEFIKRLRPVTYQLNTQEWDAFIRQNMPSEVDSNGNPIEDTRDFTRSMSKIHAGFIAQEVEQAAAEVGFVSSMVHHPVNETDPYALSYSQMVVPLVKAVQEQQVQIDELRDQLSQCCTSGSNKTDENLGNRFNNDNATIVELGSSDDVILYQNIPNPFGEETTINFYLPQVVRSAKMVFYDNMGKVIKEVVITQKGNASIIVRSSELSTGVYSYSLVVDEKVSGTKMMVKQK